MTARQAKVLERIIDGCGGSFGVSAASIATWIGAPEPSIRRTIQELIRMGHNVSFAADGLYYYRKGY